MRIALLIERFEPGIGGAENVAWRVADGLARAGDEVHVVARRAAPCPGVTLHPVSVPSFWQPLRVYAFSRAAAKAAPRGDYDVVYSLARTLHQDCYRAGAGSHLDYLRRRHSFPARQLRRLSPRHAVLADFERRVFGDVSQLVVCNSEMVRGEIEDRYRVPPRRLRVIRNGVALDRFAAPRQDRERLRGELAAGDDAVFLFAGSGFARKGLDTALRTLARARVRAQLWVAGSDDTRPWQRRATELGVAERVRFVGFRRDLPAFYAAADALLLPTRYDAFANVCLEAAAAGLPVLTSGANGAAELFRVAGRVVEAPDDANGFAEALEALCEPDLRRRLGEAARAVAAAHGWDAHVAALRALFAQARG
ncbi:MAG TPA: glycosyltransferase family 4 protein [Myxococcota bacterium]|jgi:UDP-glucose:(heptosyl)LPS alpha-1,3-glucosyltransferase